MKKDHAIDCLKEILENCRSVNPDYFTLMYEAKPDDPFATGYVIHIKAFMDSVCKQEVKKIVEKNGLAMSEEKDSLVIFKPKK